ncbi:hypothetical protein SAMN02745181_3054 [Rubritalea squalenifaciens DSM 18772]|uniref:MFS transporter n=2 Tax=Rubritalea TaxID=361050 RepID=A0A1M6P263_9BACT|nr:VC0807 family protein [Rubritalea squalenifaciens]SHK02097.1 hypothetical protein SAMN02745181_3054 [Rubritalea squalenifaciens DSM 18772]
MAQAQKDQENPLLNILINVLAPVLILSHCSKEVGKFYHIGPVWAMTAALALPLGYGIWHFINHKKLNIFSCVGLGAILLTGLITIYLWSSEAAKPHVALIFGLKEAIQPLLLGSLFLITHRTPSPLFRTFIYNESIFDIRNIEKVIAEKESHPDYEALIWKSTLLFFGSFCISAILNMGLAYYFLGDLTPSTPDWKEVYNSKVAQITGWGFLVIGAPLMLVGGYILFTMIGGLKKLTGLDTDRLMVPR